MTISQIFVVGMHRSGTSAVTNLLANMGAYFGREEESIGSNPENPKGFWERRDVRWANDNLLHSLGCEWDALSHWDLNRLNPETLHKFRQDVIKIYSNLSKQARTYVIKDPRLCLLLPLWVAASGKPVMVFVHRNPEEVALSLQKRNGYSISFGLQLWECYASHALHYSRQLPSIFVDYERLISNELGESRRLHRFFNDYGIADLHSDGGGKVAGTVESGLRNQQASLGDSLLSEPQKNLKYALQQLCKDEPVAKDFPPKIVRSSDREECLRALEKYRRTKSNYDDLQVYKDQLKKKITELDNSIRPVRRAYHEIQYERNLLRHFDFLPRWISRSIIVRFFMKALTPFAGIQAISNLLNYYHALVDLMIKTDKNKGEYETR